MDRLCDEILNSLESGVIAVDAGGTIMTANAASRRLLRQGADSLRRGERLADVPAALPLVELFEEVAERQAPAARREVAIALSSGEGRILGVSASLLGQGDGYGGAIFLFTDLTDLRKMERAAELNRQLASLGELTAGVVHELRNSISIIQGMTELVQRKIPDEHPAAGNLETILEEIGELSKSVSMFLGFAHPDRMEPSRCYPGELAERAVKLCRPRAHKKGAQLALKGDGEGPPIYADAAKLAQAVTNLINNAVDAVGEGGRVEVSVGAEDECAVLSVEDDGPGIEPGKADELFKAFVTHKEGGTGLGLSLVHRIVTAHGGEVVCANREGGGAQFSIRMPRMDLAGAASGVPPPLL